VLKRRERKCWVESVEGGLGSSLRLKKGKEGRC
jgi:hypothetical protein